MSKPRVNWYADEVIQLLEGITYDGLLRAGYQVEAEAKIGAPVDTGFMRNTIYVHSAKASTFRVVTKDDRESADSPPSAEPNVVYVGVGALYAVYVETDQPFLYPALMKVAKQIGEMIKAEARGKL